jgi:hypothetical protein
MKYNNIPILPPNTKIYLDDERKTPTGYFRVYKAIDVLAILLKNKDNITEISLDNDLGIGTLEGRIVLDVLERWLYERVLQKTPKITIHSQNGVAVARMNIVKRKIYKLYDVQI